MNPFLYKKFIINYIAEILFIGFFLINDKYMSIVILLNIFTLSLQAGILMGEINLIWPEIRRQIDDPFLVTLSAFI